MTPPRDPTSPAALSAALTAAIRAACAARGDSARNQIALLAECLALDAAGQADMLEHFRAEAVHALPLRGVPVDAYRLMCMHLEGMPPPVPPALPGRIFRAPPVTDADPGLAAFEAAAPGRRQSFHIELDSTE